MVVWLLQAEGGGRGGVRCGGLGEVDKGRGRGRDTITITIYARRPTQARIFGPGMHPGASYAHIVSGGSVRRNTATATTAQKTTVTGGGSTAHARWMDVRETTDHDRRLDPGAIVVLRIAYIHSHTPPHRLAHTAEIRTAVMSEAYWLVRALGPISGRGSHGGSGGGRSERYPRGS